MVMKRYTFTVGLSGIGNSPEEAWIDAINQFSNDPGEPTDYETDELDLDVKEE
jgi:hypothetical protein